MIAARYGLVLGAVVCCSAFCATPPSAPPPPPTSQSSGATPDEDFIEFLGVDDIGDAAWWEFLKKAPPRGKDVPATPPQDSKHD